MSGNKKIEEAKLSPLNTTENIDTQKLIQLLAIFLQSLKNNNGNHSELTELIQSIENTEKGE